MLVTESVITAYLAASLALGAVFKSKADSVKGFLVANREIGKWLLAFTFGATYFSSVVIVVGGAWAYMWGTDSLLIPALNVVLGALATFIFLGRRVNRLSIELDALTVPELFGRLYSSRGLQRLMGAMAAVGLTLYAATVVSSASAMLASVLHLNIALVAAVVAGVMAVYVAMGGMYSVVWTDTLQGVIMASGVLLLLVFSLSHVGGLAALAEAKPALPPGRVDRLLILDLALLTSVAVWGLPQLINRFYTASSPSVIKRATGIATLFAFIVSYGSFLSGLAAARIIPPGRVGDPLKAIPSLVHLLFGPVGAAVFTAAVLAAAMSTADSIALTVGSSIVYDVAGRRDTRLLRLASFASMLAAAAIAVLTLAMPRSMASAVTAVFRTGWTFTAGAFLVPVAATVLGYRSRAAVLASSAVGALTALAYGVAKALHLALPLMNLSFTVTVAASLAAYAASYAAAR